MHVHADDAVFGFIGYQPYLHVVSMAGVHKFEKCGYIFTGSYNPVLVGG